MSRYLLSPIAQKGAGESTTTLRVVTSTSTFELNGGSSVASSKCATPKFAIQGISASPLDLFARLQVFQALNQGLIAKQRFNIRVVILPEKL